MNTPYKNEMRRQFPGLTLRAALLALAFVLGFIQLALQILEASTNPSNQSHRTARTTGIIWQKWIDNQLPRIIEKRWKHTMAMNPTYERRVFGDSEADDFMRQHFYPGPTYDAFRSINPDLGAMKADLWRYCVLYIHGGIYVDADSEILVPLHKWVMDDRAIISKEGNIWRSKDTFDCVDIWRSIKVTFPEKIVEEHSYVQWALVFPKPQHSILRETIRLVTELITSWRDTADSVRWATKHKTVCLTGPMVYSVAINNVYNQAVASGSVSRGNGSTTAYSSWDPSVLNDTTLLGVDFNGHMNFKNLKFASAMDKLKKSYERLDKSIPIKTTTS